MKSKLALLLATATCLAVERQGVQTEFLDDHVIYSVPVSTNRITTISFPGPISAIDAVGVSVDPKVPGEFQLAHTKGSSFLSIRALSRKATTNLNIRWNKHTYVFELMESESPVLSLILQSKAVGQSVEAAPRVSPMRLLALLDKAKAFPLLKKQQPESVAQVEFKTFVDPPSVTDSGDYEIQIEEILRFNPEDTLVFRVLIRNKTEGVMRFRPDSFSVRAGNRVYPQSISDAGGLIPPKNDATAYFAVTGTPDGGRNELSLKNDFSVLLERLPAEVTNIIAVPVKP